MAFTDLEIAEHSLTLEQHFWTHHRPPLHLRDKVREGQRFTDQSIELFIVRPAFNRPGEHIEESIAKVTYVRGKAVWHLFWKRADGKGHRYPPHPEANSLAAALAVIHADANGCFFGGVCHSLQEGHTPDEREYSEVANACCTGPGAVTKEECPAQQPEDLGFPGLEKYPHSLGRHFFNPILKTLNWKKQ